MIRDSHYRAKLPFRARGHAELERRIGGVFCDIDERLERQDVVRVLELGCGYGTVLLELAHRYGERVAVHGINRQREDGNEDILRRNRVERQLIATSSTDPLPALMYVDVGDGLPFGEGTFDIVYSQVAWLYFGNKIHVLREVIRVLGAEGLAKIDADEICAELPMEYQRLVEIWEHGQLIPFGDYLRRHHMGFASAAEGDYLRFGKSPRFGEDLEMVCQIDMSKLHAHWDGIKCVYRIRA